MSKKSELIIDDSEETNLLMSFNEIMKSSFVSLGNKYFIRKDNHETLGIVSAKYNERCKMEAILNGGIIEFTSLCKSLIITKIYGNALNKNEKLFIERSIKKI
jgi:hypothetical protein